MKSWRYIIVLINVLICIGNVREVQAAMSPRTLDSLQIVVPKGQLILPGESFQFEVIAHQKNGEIFKTSEKNKSKLPWRKLDGEVIGGKWKRGKVDVSELLMPAKGKYIRLRVWPRRHEELATSILVPLNYETEVKFLPNAGFTKAPGCAFKGQILVRFDNGMKRRYTDPFSKSTSKLFSFGLDGLTKRRNRFYIESDFRKICDHRVYMQILSSRNPDLVGEFSFLLDYKYDYRLVLRGYWGSSGFSGSDGSDGSWGGDGGNGQHGGDGEPGGHGPDIGVWTDAYYDSTLQCNLLYIFAENFRSGKEYAYLVNPNGGSFRVASYGGDGGRGGDGGDGGDGAKGRDGRIWYETVTKTRMVQKPFEEKVTKTVKKTITNSDGEEEEVEEEITETKTVYKMVEERYTEKIEHQEPGEDGGDGGNGGCGGVGGPGGWGGNIYLFFTKDALKYAQLVDADSGGGSGGMHGDAGDGGRGGRGGDGDPDGYSGRDGWDGSEYWGWATSGCRGEIFIEPTDEFVNYDSTALAK